MANALTLLEGFFEDDLGELANLVIDQVVDRHVGFREVLRKSAGHGIRHGRHVGLTMKRGPMAGDHRTGSLDMSRSHRAIVAVYLSLSAMVRRYTTGVYWTRLIRIWRSCSGSGENCGGADWPSMYCVRRYLNSAEGFADGDWSDSRVMSREMVFHVGGSSFFGGGFATAAGLTSGLASLGFSKDDESNFRLELEEDEGGWDGSTGVGDGLRIFGRVAGPICNGTRGKVALCNRVFVLGGARSVKGDVGWSEMG
jgi:hypothetical protein